MCLSLYLFKKVSLLAILVVSKSNDAHIKLFSIVYVKEMSISLYF
jgi:hypothetical protein